MNNNFTKDSIIITKKLTKKEIKDNGIFFTPQSIIKKCYDIILNNINLENKNILEPSCGSMEFINYLNNNMNINNYKNITCIEKNNKIYEIIKLNNNSNINIEIINNDFFKWNSSLKYDLIIGNPPYVIINKKSDIINKSYLKFFEGRPNLFILFIIKSLELLEINGILCFVLPISFMNCLYYNNLRLYIYNNFTIIDIILCNDDNFLQTEQNTLIFIIQNKIDPLNEINKKYIININNYLSFNSIENIIKLNNILNTNYNTLNNLKCKLSIGNIVWNQCKNILTDDNTFTRLIYNSDIINNKLDLIKYKNIEKKNYIKKKGIKDKIIVLNRGYGPGKYKLNYCLINEDYEYLIENHLIQIKCPDDKLIDVILSSFSNKKTNEFIDLYFGNAAINIAELNHIIPIFN